MEMNRRGFFALLAGFLALPFAKPSKKDWNTSLKELFQLGSSDKRALIPMTRMQGKAEMARVFSEDLEKAFLGLRGTGAWG